MYATSSLAVTVAFCAGIVLSGPAAAETQLAPVGPAASSASGALESNRITLNRITLNRISANRITLNRITLNGAALASGSVASVEQVRLADGTILIR